MKGLAKWIQAVTSWTRNMWKDWLLPSGCSRSNEGKSNYFRTFVLIIFDIGGGSVRGVECNGVGSGPRMKISVIMDISVLGFYGYIRYIRNISMDILAQNIDRPKIDQNLWKCEKKLLKMKLEV